MSLVRDDFNADTPSNWSLACAWQALQREVALAMERETPLTRDEWRAAVLLVVADHAAGDSARLDRLAQLLTEQASAKADLLRAGFGCAGMPWAALVLAIVHNADF